MTIEDTMAALHAFADSLLGDDGSGHGMDHVERVEANAQHLLAATPDADSLTVRAAALLHDCYDDKLFDDVPVARQRVVDELQQVGVDDARIAAIMRAIDTMSYHYSLDHPDVQLSLEGQLVQDADRLDAIGAIGIARAFTYGGAKDRPLYSKQGPRTELTGANYRQGSDTINHFYEKLLLLADKMNTSAAKKTAAERTTYMRGFLDQFAAEVRGER